MKKLFLALPALLILAFGLISGSSQQVSASDHWAPASSVGINGSPSNTSYFNAANTWRIEGEAGTSQSFSCFGTWGLNDPQGLNATLGGTRTCVGDNDNIPADFSTLFDESPQSSPLGEVFTDAEVFSNQQIYAVANYNLEAAGINVATGLYSIGGAGHPLTPIPLSNQLQSDQKQHRIMQVITFKNYIYIATESRTVAGSSFGAQIWRHDPFTAGEFGSNQSQWAASLNRWQKVVGAGDDLPSTQYYGVTHMFKSIDGTYLFAALQNAGAPARLLRSADGVSWSLLSQQFGSNGSAITSSAIFNGELYVGGAGLYSTSSANGSSWSDKRSLINNNSARAMVRTSGDELLAGNGSVLYRSTDGSSFTLEALPAGFANISSLIASPNGRVFAGTGQNPSTYSSPRNARIWCEGCNEPPIETGTLKINLPPKSVYVPNQLEIEAPGGAKEVYTFNASEEFTPPQSASYTVSTTQINTGSLTSYEITISPIVRGGAAQLPGRDKLLSFNRFLGQFSARAYSPPPATNYLLLGSGPVYDFKLTYTPTANGRSAVNSLANEPEIVSGSYDYASLSDGGCGGGDTHICFTPLVSVVNFSGSVNGDLPLREVVRLDQPGSIVVEGNTVATTQVGGFSFPQSGGWVAVGGNFTASFQANNSINNELLDDYINQTGSELVWGNVGNSSSIAYKINQRYLQGRDKASTISSASYDGIFNLNSVSQTDPSNVTVSSFTTQPGGKIWYQNQSVTLNNIDFRGFGTLLVNGNLTVNGELGCQSNARLGVIVTGNITFNNPTINCGAFVAMGTTETGSINFSSNISSDTEAKGIFAAKSNISLPTVNEGNRYDIRYDALFARDPSALFKEVLDIIFTTSS